MIVSCGDRDNYACTPLTSLQFSLISSVFINIHGYANYQICISEHQMKVQCLNIQLVPIQETF